MPTTPNYPHTFILALIVLVSACTPLVKTQDPNTARTTIISQNEVSHSTKAVLTSAGFTQASCLADFNECVIQIGDTLASNRFDERQPPQKFTLATLAELHLAYAKSLASSPTCQGLYVKDPLNPNYPNTYSQKSDEQKHTEQLAYQACLNTHRTALYNTLKYSYAHLFFEPLTKQPIKAQPFIDEQTIKAQDLYNASIALLIDGLHHNRTQALFEKPAQTLNKTDKMLALSTIHTHDKSKQYTLTLHLANDPYLLRFLRDDDSPIFETLSSVYQQDLSDIGLISTRTGIGVGYVGSLFGRHTNTLKTFSQHRQNSSPSFTNNDPANRIFEPSHLTLTGVIVPLGDTLDEVLTTQKFDAYFFNPYASDSMTILGQPYPLYANFSAGYAGWIKDNQFDKVALANLLIKNNGQLPELYLLEPYNPNKKVIIMLHGLASSPQTWVKVTNNLLADTTLKDNYQVWQVFYATNLPILENRYQIQTLIKTAFEKYDPKNTQTNSVLMGHSMGGIISRLLVSDDNLLTALDALEKTNQYTSSQQKRANLSDEEKQLLNERFLLRPLPQITTAIFISAPHKGTDYADRWFTRGLRRAIHLPIGFSRDVKSVVKGFLDNQPPKSTSPSTNTPLSALGELYLQNGASQLSTQSAFMQLTQNTHIAPHITYHSIMGNSNKTGKHTGELSGQYISDGIVPYDSSHLDGAESEAVLSGNHSIHDNPKTILHLRQILHYHLNQTNKP